MSSGYTDTEVSRGGADNALRLITALVLGGVALALLAASILDPATYGVLEPMVLLLAGSALAWVMAPKVGGLVHVAALIVGWVAVLVSLGIVFARSVG